MKHISVKFNPKKLIEDAVKIKFSLIVKTLRF